jgi:glutathione S-transferase
MANPALIIGNKNYSSWSLRPWLLMKAKGIAFDEVLVPLYQQDSKVAIQAHAPDGRARYGKVPILRDGATTVWDSLAICEYVAERWPHTQCWPHDLATRAHARSISAEMHSGFGTLRSEMPMNCRRRHAPIAQAGQLQAEIDRVVEIWTSCRASKPPGGPFLFGAFTIADAMYAPVVLRFATYAVALPAAAQAYADAMVALPPVGEWIAEACTETEVLEKFER